MYPFSFVYQRMSSVHPSNRRQRETRQYRIRARMAWSCAKPARWPWIPQWTRQWEEVPWTASTDPMKDGASMTSPSLSPLWLRRAVKPVGRGIHGGRNSGRRRCGVDRSSPIPSGKIPSAGVYNSGRPEAPVPQEAVPLLSAGYASAMWVEAVESWPTSSFLGRRLHLLV
jgi:hypothetical protein